MGVGGVGESGSGIAPTQLNPDFQAVRINGFDLDDPNVSSGTNGILALNNTGLVITNINACTYYPNGNYTGGGLGTSGTQALTGYSAIVQAVLDGYNNGGWNGNEGITGTNAIQNPNVYGIGFAYVNDLGYAGTSWGGVSLTGTDATSNGGNGDLLIRETYTADSNLKGYVDIAHDYTNWLAAYSQGSQSGLAPSGPVGMVAADFGFYSLQTGQPVDIAHDYTTWLASYSLYTNGGSFQLGGSDISVTPGHDWRFWCRTRARLAAPVGGCGIPGRIFAGRAGCCESWVSYGLQLWAKGWEECTSLLGLLTGFVVLSFAVGANAELVYFLVPVTNDPNCYSDPNNINNVANANNQANGGSGTGTNANDYAPGIYSVSGNGVSTPFSVTITGWNSNDGPDGTVTPPKTTSVSKLFALIKGTAKGWQYQAMGSANVTVQQSTGTYPLNLTPDVGDTWFSGPYAAGNSSGGTVVGTSIGVLNGPGGTDASYGIIATANQGGYVFPGTASAKNLATATGGIGTYVSSLSTYLAVSSGSLAAVRLGDVFFTYGPTGSSNALPSAGTATLQALAYTSPRANSFRPSGGATRPSGCRVR